MKKTIIVSTLFLVFLAKTSWSILGIGDVVIDPTNLVQNTLTATNMVKSTTQQALQVKQDLDFYLQQAKHLVAIPQSYIEDITRLYNQYNALMQQGSGMTYTLKNSLDQFQKLYDVSFNGHRSMMDRAKAVIGQVRAASQQVTQMTAIFDRLCAQQGKVAQLITVSQAAPGSLAAQQATNQLMAVLADQQGSLQQIAAATGRVQVGFIMRQVTAEEQAQWQAQQWMEGYGQGTFKGPGQGEGPRLPQ